MVRLTNIICWWLIIIHNLNGYIKIKDIDTLIVNNWIAVSNISVIIIQLIFIWYWNVKYIYCQGGIRFF